MHKRNANMCVLKLAVDSTVVAMRAWHEGHCVCVLDDPSGPGFMNTVKGYYSTKCNKRNKLKCHTLIF